MTYSSTAEDMVPYPRECAFGAQRLRHLCFGIAETQSSQVRDDFAMLLKMGIDLDQNRFQMPVGEHAAAAGQHLVFEAVDVDLDVIGYGHHAAVNHLIQGHGETSLRHL